MQLQQDKEPQPVDPLQSVTAYTVLCVDNSSSRLNQQESLSEWETVIMHLCSMTCVVQYWW